MADSMTPGTPEQKLVEGGLCTEGWGGNFEQKGTKAGRGVVNMRRAVIPPGWGFKSVITGGVVASLLNQRLAAVNPPGSCGIGDIPAVSHSTAQLRAISRMRNIAKVTVWQSRNQVVLAGLAGLGYSGVMPAASMRSYKWGCVWLLLMFTAGNWFSL